MKNSYLVTAILVILVGAGAFFAGTKYQQRTGSTGRFGNLQGTRNGNFGQRGQGLRPVNGEVISLDNKSITVKMQDGSSKIVLLTDKTAISTSSAGSRSDLKSGEKVAVFGTENSDGSVTAQSVQLNPILRFGQGSQNGPLPSGSSK